MLVICGDNESDSLNLISLEFSKNFENTSFINPSYCSLVRFNFLNSSCKAVSYLRILNSSEIDSFKISSLYAKRGFPLYVKLLSLKYSNNNVLYFSLVNVCSFSLASLFELDKSNRNSNLSINVSNSLYIIIPSASSTILYFSIFLPSWFLFK